MNNSLDSLLADGRLARVAHKLAAMRRPGIRLETSPCAEDELPLGASRIGGRPDLAENVVWPVWKGAPLAFLAQINLGDLATFPFAGVLPRAGWLLFFYDAEQSTWGFDPRDRGSWAVVWMPDAGARLERRGVPAEGLPNGFYSLCRVGMHEVLTLPPYESPAVASLKLRGEEQDAYWELLEQDEAGDGKCHQILGHANPIQGDMQLDCQLASNGVYCGDSAGYRSLKARMLARGAADWRLLFQLDTDNAAGMMWGDAGMLYFWMRQADLEKRKFEKSWMVLQCS